MDDFRKAIEAQLKKLARHRGTNIKDMNAFIRGKLVTVTSPTTEEAEPKFSMSDWIRKAAKR